MYLKPNRINTRDSIENQNSRLQRKYLSVKLIENGNIVIDKVGGREVRVVEAVGSIIKD